MLQIRRLVLAVVSAMLATVLAAPAVAAAGNHQNPRAVNPIAHRARYQTLAAEWWQWAFSTRSETGGPFDAGPVHCAVNQPRSNVLFLAAPFNTSGTVDRTCTDPVGRATQLFFPVINTECSNLEDPPFFGATPKERRHCVNQDLFNPANLSATVDGQSFPVSKAKFNIVSKDFAFTAVPGNPVGFTGSGQSTTRGVWLLLKPLQKGNHTIKFTGSYPDPLLNFSVSVTYRLTVN
jgi:hypothetical protein